VHVAPSWDPTEGLRQGVDIPVAKEASGLFQRSWTIGSSEPRQSLQLVLAHVDDPVIRIPR
jgi:hypothetical protein